MLSSVFLRKVSRLFNELLFEGKVHDFKKRLLRGFKELRYRRVIDYMLLEVCSACQNKCEHCAHAGLIAHNQNYNLPIQKLRTFLSYTLRSHYYIETLNLHGPGEPTLWRHLNEGIKMIHDSKVVGRIIIETNGLSLERINRNTWRYINQVVISDYPSLSSLISRDVIREHWSKVRYTDKSFFRPAPYQKYENTIPCFCMCPGPMFYDENIFFHCGPPAFHAANVANLNLFDFPEFLAPLKLDFFEPVNKIRTGRLSLCEYCWANSNIEMPIEPHKSK
jgi:hypothetical protein